MRILGIETSCDETAIAILDGDGANLKVLKSVVLSQIETHAKYGGVVPEVAAREHVKAIFPMLQKEVEDFGEIDVIAVTAGPGLASALRVGVETAKTLAWVLEKPLVPVSHIEGHIMANWLFAPSGSPMSGGGLPSFPALCLVVSGGHTELILMKDYGEFERVGETLDDAAGEAFDKVAKMLGLGYPGGPEIAKLAENGDKTAFDFPRGLLNRPNLDFSFSGIKTSVLYKLRNLEDENLLNDQVRANVAASFQEAVVDVLARKTVRAAKEFEPVSILLAGGVAANKELRARLKEEFGDKLFVPEMKYSTDNAAMIAAAGYFRAQNSDNFVNPVDLKADSNLDIV